MAPPLSLSWRGPSGLVVDSPSIQGDLRIAELPGKGVACKGSGSAAPVRLQTSVVFPCSGWRLCKTRDQRHARELLGVAEPLIEKKLHPTLIVPGAQTWQQRGTLPRQSESGTLLSMRRRRITEVDGTSRHAVQ